MSSWTPSHKNIYLRLWRLISPFKGWVLFSILCMGGYNIFSAAPAYYAKDIVDALAYGDKPELSQFFLVLLITFFSNLFYQKLFFLKLILYLLNTSCWEPQQIK